MDPRYYRINQLANIFAPGIGLLLSIPGLVLLLAQATRYGDGWRMLSSAVFGATVVVSYACFTLYHIYKFNPRWGRIFKIIDHSSIYLLIAGTYTPFALVYLRGHWGWTLFSVVWVLAVAGVVFKIFFIHRFKIAGPLFFLAMGWLIVVAIKPAIDHIPAEALYLLFAGGLFYSFGLIFYAWKQLRFHHAVWHLFVFAGTALHYCAVLWHVIRASA